MMKLIHLIFKYFSAILFTAFSGGGWADNLSAEEVMQLNNSRYLGDTRESLSTLILIDKKGRKRLRSLKTLAVEDKQVERTIVYFQSPSEIKGTSYMSFDWKDTSKEDDSWLYLTSLQKVKRVASSAKSSSFMGSDFNYADINGLDHEDFDYSFIKENEILNGVECWVISALPKNTKVISETGYTALTVWIRKDNYIRMRGKMHLKKGNRVKYFTASDFLEIDGIWRAKTLQMITTKGGKKEHASILKYEDIRHNTKVDLSHFDTQAMQRGL